ncbi:hypothetical protein F4859DRAFT_38183 [Xylaria cf. heliscus]|nr:hypothetical protein F4859DRAFT_38183 [Xylaria cf. heliscus]
MIHSLSLLFLATGALSSILPLFPPKQPSNAPTYPTDGCPSCSKPAHCSNEGWDWAYYPNPLTNSGENYPGFRADAFKTQTPTYTGTTPFIGGVSALGAGDGKIYNSTTALGSTYFALNQHAYLWACEGGAWQFDVTGVDDLVLAWVGDDAYTGWTDDNAASRAVWAFQTTGSHSGSASFTADLEGGAFVPLRFFFANGQGGGAFRLTITSPSGIIVHQSGRATNNDWIVRHSCEYAPKAPEFPGFGQES